MGRGWARASLVSVNDLTALWRGLLQNEIKAVLERLEERNKMASDLSGSEQGIPIDKQPLIPIHTDVICSVQSSKANRCCSRRDGV